MKKNIYITIILITIFFIPNIYAHDADIIDKNDKKSFKVSFCDKKYYGYHLDKGEYHFHQIAWSNELKSWEIVSEEVFLRSPCSLKQNKRYEVELSTCVDGDTVKLILNKEIITARFLAVDTPEINHSNPKIKKFANLAKKYTCDFLKRSKLIEIEYDEKSNKTDKYGRHLVWIFTEEGLLQESLVENGYAKIAYLYGRYKYTPDLQIIEEKISKTKRGIWQFQETDYSKQSSGEQTKKLTEEEKTEKLIFVILVIVITIITIVKKIMEE